MKEKIYTTIQEKNNRKIKNSKDSSISKCFKKFENATEFFESNTKPINDNLEDEFGKKQYPTPQLTEKLINITKQECQREKVNFHNVPNFSLDTMFAQFPYIDNIKNMKCQTLEMETAVLFKCAEITKINTTALFGVSDNTVANKSLFSGRSDEENAYRYNVRFNVMPKILFRLIEDL